MRILTFVLLCACSALACSRATPQAAVSVPQPAALLETTEKAIEQKHRPLQQRGFKDSGFPVVGHLKARGETVTIFSGPNGPLYTVRDKAGRVLLWEGTPKELRTQCPAWHTRTEKGIAIAW